MANTNRKLIAEYTANHNGFTCTAYLTAGPLGLAVHTITRGSVLFGKSAMVAVKAADALTVLRSEADRAPLF